MIAEGDIDAAVQVTLDRLAKGMLRGMVFFQTSHMQSLNVPNTGVRKRRTRDTVAGKKGSSYTVYPNPSKPGEYPRKITGQGQAGVTYAPFTPEQIVADGMVSRIGHRAFMSGDKFGPGGRKIAHGVGWNYMVTLEQKMNRLGYIESAQRLRAQVAAFVTQRG